jgi:hypothetical protein
MGAHQVTAGIVLLLAAACTFEAKPESPPGATDVDGSNAGAPVERPVETLTVDVGNDTKVFVKLAPLGEASVAGHGAESTEWDLAFTGWDVFTNGGVSGPGQGGAFGPLDSVAFALGDDPSVPFIQADETGGPFRDWYEYDGTTHALYSRYHVYGIRAADRFYKFQILSYYGELEGAPVSALYRVRYAEVTVEGSSEVHELENVDGTAGWPNVSDAAPSGCLNLHSGAPLALTPDDARASDAWHVCFRRDGVSVNGERGGPGGVSAADLDQSDGEAETVDEVRARTTETERERFDTTDLARLTSPSVSYSGDRVVSIFSDAWVDRAAAAPVPMDATWLVVGADGASRFLIHFESVEDSTERAVGRVTLRVRTIE